MKGNKKTNTLWLVSLASEQKGAAESWTYLSRKQNKYNKTVEWNS